MKVLKYFICLILAITSSFCCVFARQTLISSEPVEIRETFVSNEKTKRKNFISYAELSDDIDYLFYYLKTAYAGYDELLQNGFSEENFRAHFREKYENSEEIETENSVYISLSSFKVHENDSKFKKGSEIVLKKFADLGKTWQNKKNILIDLRSNGGGMIEYGIYPFYAMTQKNPQSFKNFQKANIFSNDFFFEQLRTTSPASLQAHIKYFEDLGEKKCLDYKKYKKDYEKNLKSPQKRIFKQQCDFSKEIKTYFKGKVIFHRNSYSASELSPLFAKRILGENVKIIGENSAGCIQFGDVLPYQLPNSRIAISLSSAKNTLLTHFENWHGEQYGIYPDYWSLGCDLNETIFLETNDSEMKEKLKNIEFRLL